MPEIRVFLPKARSYNRYFDAHVPAARVVGNEISEGARFKIAQKSARQLVHHVRDEAFFAAAALERTFVRFKGAAEKLEYRIKRGLRRHAVELVAAAGAADGFDEAAFVETLEHLRQVRLRRAYRRGDLLRRQTTVRLFRKLAERVQSEQQRLRQIYNWIQLPLLLRRVMELWILYSTFILRSSAAMKNFSARCRFVKHLLQRA